MKMTRKRRSSTLYYHKKNCTKLIKTIIQFAILLVVGTILYREFFVVNYYKEPDKAAWSNKKGFIALSYFGVGRSGTPKLVDKKLLDEELKVLHDQGYTTISQQDILDYYSSGKPLPDKALFLSFEDGRNDSSLFTQPLLEKYNLKATFLSYANKLHNSEQKFVQPKEMHSMMDSGYWEMGSNGYRLTYINLFDKDGNYIGVKDESELANVQNLEYYNHYLMDFIRDENMIPLEDRNHMEARINKDYELMQDNYNNELGFVPKTYMIMHANALYSGMNKLVEDVNSANIHRLFQLHFNREGNVFNGETVDPYNLTRVQVAPFWYTNHLLMKIQKDTGQQVEFINGDKRFSQKWTAISGAAQFTNNRIVLTSLPAKSGLLVLNDSGDLNKATLHTKLSGNVVGKQSIYVRYDQEKDSFVRIILDNNTIYVEQKKPGQAVEQIETRKLQDISWKAEDLAYSKATVYSKEQISARNPAEDEAYPTNIKGSREIEINLDENSLNISVDKSPLIDHLVIDDSISRGSIALESQYSKVNKKDDIYDGVFEDVQVVNKDERTGQSTVVFTNKLSGVQKVIDSISNAVNSAIDWAINTF